MVPKLIACLSSKGRLAGVRLQNRYRPAVSTAFIDEPSLQSCERW
jgi:hypothetical protein